jgi:hypothetical protein
MTNIYYTAREGRRSANGHTLTRGEVYKVTQSSKEPAGIRSRAARSTRLRRVARSLRAYAHARRGLQGYAE